MYLVYAEGRAFEGRQNLRTTLDLLDPYEICFSRALQVSQKSLKIRPATRTPKVYIERLQGNSLEAYLTIVAAGLTVEASRYAPQAISLAWETFKKSFRFVEYSVSFFDRIGRPPQINVGDITFQPYFEISGDDNIVQVDRGTYDLATQVQKRLHEIASMVSPGQVSNVEVSSTEEEEPLSINQDNKARFGARSAEQTDSEPVELECNIYRLNKESLKGHMEVPVDNETVKKIPFNFNENQLEDCATAWSAPSTRILAYRVFQVDALGQSTIKELHLSQIIANNYTE